MMTPAELNDWLPELGLDQRTHLRQLSDLAYYGDPKQRVKGTFTDASQYVVIDGVAAERDRGRAAAEDAIQAVLARALGSRAFAKLPKELTWPWLVSALRSELHTRRRAWARDRRARKEVSGAILVEKGNRGRWTPAPVGEEEDANTALRCGARGTGRIVFQEEGQDDEEHGHNFQGPKGAKGEYTLALTGECKCKARSTARYEHGFDGERNGYSRTRVVAQLEHLAAAVRYETAGSIRRLAAFAVGCVMVHAMLERKEYLHEVNGCWNGHREYEDIALPKGRQ